MSKKENVFVPEAPRDRMRKSTFVLIICHKLLGYISGRLEQVTGVRDMLLLL
jgi:hypothetical protein